MNYFQNMTIFYLIFFRSKHFQYPKNKVYFLKIYAFLNLNNYLKLNNF